MTKIDKKKLKYMRDLGSSQVVCAYALKVTPQAVSQSLKYESKMEAKRKKAKELEALGLAIEDIQKILGHKHIISTRQVLAKKVDDE